MNLLRRAVWLGLVLALALLWPGGAGAQDQGVAVITFTPLEGAILSGLVPMPARPPTRSFSATS